MMSSFGVLFFFVTCLFWTVGARGSESGEVDAQSLQKKCMVELRYQFVPRHCYRWVQVVPLNSERRKFLQEWFNGICKKALNKNEDHVQYHVHQLASLSKECQVHMESAFTLWSYKSKAENPEKLLQVMFFKGGKELEYSNRHDEKEARRNRSTGSFRRRLN